MIDKKSPKYPAYMEECKELQAEAIARTDELLSRLKEEGNYGLDSAGFGELHSEISAKLKAIQKKYGFD